MASTKALNDRAARDAGICYLCGVSGGSIRSKWNLSLTDVHQSIINDKSHKWNDALLEYYRPRCRSHLNLAHFYLSYQDHENPLIENKDLVDRVRDLKIYEAIYGDIINPIIQEIALKTGLKYFIEPHSGAECLLTGIFGVRTIDNMLGPLLLHYLYTKVPQSHIVNSQAGENFSLNELKEEVIRWLVYLLKQGGAGMTPHKESIIKRSLKTLSERECLVLQLNYGLSGVRKFSLEEIGKLLNLTAERVRQIKQKALRRLRHASRSEKLREIHELMIDPANRI